MAAPSAPPAGMRPIKRVKFTTTEELIAMMKPQSVEAVPLIIEGCDIMNVEKWADLKHLESLLQDRTVLVKRSKTCKFRYFDMKKNTGKFAFDEPVEELQRTLGFFLEESERVLKEGSEERMYLQETLCGHAEMAEEFASWKWELLIRVSTACGWGLPDSNELFIGMVGAETPLHFDERENLFFQVRGRKELVTYPFVDYPKLYPFPTTHPCDRQSMVGSPFEADLEAFPRFREATAYHATLQAGDTIYLPYGWWHWLKNVDHHAVSVSFWSNTPKDDFSEGIPAVLSEHMLTRARRNLETMISQLKGPENLNATMLKLRESVLANDQTDEVFATVRKLLTILKLAPEFQDNFILQMIEGRFGIDWQKHV